MEKLITEHQRRINRLKNVYKRDVFEKLESNHRITGIVGQRGVGKTTYLLYYLKQKYGNNTQALYVSADDVYFIDNTLVDFVRQFIDEYDGKIVCIDEIHKYQNWAQELKNIYDKYPEIKIIFSGSSSIDLVKEKYDLSRRAVLRYLNGLSFREFLEIKLNTKYPTLTIEDIINNRIVVNEKIVNTPKLLGLFKEYLQIGYYPVFLEQKTHKDFFEIMSGVIEKTIFMDISSFYRIQTSTMPIFKKILYFIFSSNPSTINTNKIAKSISKDHNDVANYLEMMRDSGLLRFLDNDKAGHASMRKPEKIYIKESLQN